MKSVLDGTLSIESASITADLERLFIVARRRDTSRSLVQHVLCVIDTSASISRKATRLSVIAHHVANLQLLVQDAMDNVLNHVNRAWSSFYHQQFLIFLEDLYDATKSKPNSSAPSNIYFPYQNLHVHTHVPSAINPLSFGPLVDDKFKFKKAADILLMYLAVGTVDDRTSKWLIESMTEQKLIRALIQMKQTRRTISSYVLDHFQRQLEGILFRLTELSGYVQWNGQCEALGLCQEALNALIDTADHMLHMSARFLRDMNDTCKHVRNFIDWIRDGMLSIFRIVKI